MSRFKQYILLVTSDCSSTVFSLKVFYGYPSTSGLGFDSCDPASTNHKRVVVLGSTPVIRPRPITYALCFNW